MSNIERYDSDKTDNTSSLILVRNSVIKTHCIVCNSAFLKPRAGKLYCSNKCKQFRFYHKEKFALEQKVLSFKHKRQVKKFSIEDYQRYLEMSVDLKKYKILKRRQEKFLAIQKEMNIKSQLGIIPEQKQTIDLFLYQLNTDEFYELEYFDSVYDDLKSFDAPNLSIEQWSFLKLLFNNVAERDFFSLVCQISRDYIEQLNVKSISRVSESNLSVIKSKFLIHCNEITNGLIRFR